MVKTENMFADCEWMAWGALASSLALVCMRANRDVFLSIVVVTVLGVVLMRDSLPPPFLSMSARRAEEGDVDEERKNDSMEESKASPMAQKVAQQKVAQQKVAQTLALPPITRCEDKDGDLLFHVQMSRPNIPPAKSREWYIRQNELMGIDMHQNNGYMK